MLPIRHLHFWHQSRLPWLTSIVAFSVEIKAHEVNPSVHTTGYRQLLRVHYPNGEGYVY